MRTEAEVRGRLREFFRQALRFRRYQREARSQRNTEQARYEGELALLYESGFHDLYWVLHPESETGLGGL